MSSNLLMTLYRSYCILSSTKANLRLSHSQPLTPCLVLAKPNSLEFFRILPSGDIDRLFEYQVFANLLFLTTIPSFSASTPDHLFILTADFQFSISSVSDGQITVECYGDLQHQSLDQQENPLYIQDHVICSNNSIKGYIGLLLYRNNLLLIPWKQSESRALSVSKVCKIRFAVDFTILGLVELGSTSNVLASRNEYFIGCLFEDNSGNYPVSLFKIHKIEDSDGDAREAGAEEGWAIRFEENVRKIAFLKGDRFSRGLLAFGPHNVYFYLYESKTKYEKKPVSFNIDFLHFLSVPTQENALIVSDHRSACLFLIFIDLTDQAPIEVRFLGRTSPATTMQYLEKKTIFLGSELDDSLLVRLTDTMIGNTDPEKPYLNVLQSFCNIGIVTGMEAIEQGLNQTRKLVIASALRRESLVVFQKGVSLRISTFIQIPMVIEKAVFLQKRGIFLCGNEKICFFLDFQSENGSFSVVKSMKFGVFEVIDLDSKNLVILSNERLLFLNETLDVSFELEIQGKPILSGFCEKFLGVVVQEKEGFLSFLAFSMGKFELMASKKLEKPVSALFCYGNLVFLAYWFDSTLDYFDLENLNATPFQLDISLSGFPSLLQRPSISDILIFEDKYLLLGLNNGTLIVEKFEVSGPQAPLKILQTKVLLVGDRTLRIFGTSPNIIVLSDQLFQLEIGEKGGNLIAEKVLVTSEVAPHSLSEIKASTEMELEEKVGNLLIVGSGGLAIGSLSIGAKYMVSPFGEDHNWDSNPYSSKPVASALESELIIPQKTLSKEFVAVGEDYCLAGCNGVHFEDEIPSQLLVYSLKTEEILDSFSGFGAKKEINNLIYDEAENVVLVTTDSMRESDEKSLENPLSFTIWLFYLERKRGMGRILSLITTVEMKNPIQSIKKLKKGIFAIFSGATLYLYELVKKDRLLAKFEFTEILKKAMFLDAFQIDVSGDLLIICDYYKNVNLYHYNSEDNKLLFLAKSSLGGCLSFCSFFAKDKILCFDDNGSLAISQRKKKAETDLEKISLQTLAGINFGEKINCVVKINDISCPEYSQFLPNIKEAQENKGKFVIHEILWGTDRGSIGILAELPRELFQLLMDLQESLLLEIRGKGYFGFEYEKWRQMKDFLGNRIPAFVDGTILRQLGSFPSDVIERVLNNMSSLHKPKLESFLLLIEDLERKLS